MMNILILGEGGREHTLAWKIAQSPLCDCLYVAPGNSGTSQMAENVGISATDFDAIGRFVQENAIDMVIVGPEDPLVNGIHDFFLNDEKLQHVSIIGPQKKAARLEGSKKFAKEFMFRHQIPTAAYKSFNGNSLKEGYEFLENLNPPYVLKADGLAAGKGVLILKELDEAKQELRKMLVHSKFGTASSTVVIEEFLDGIELSCFVLTDGENYKILPLAKDYKRIGEGDTGLNTGGMGAISPVPFADSVFNEKIESQIVKPTIDGLKKDNLPFKGFVFIGLIKVDDEPKVIEYNVRMGDPETEVVVPRIKNDLLEMFVAVAKNELNTIELDIDERSAATVMLVSGGYPEKYEKGKSVTGVDDVKESLVFHAGAKAQDEKIVTSGGRVIAVTSFGADYKDALRMSYRSIDKIKFDGRYYRKDIGFDL